MCHEMKHSRLAPSSLAFLATLEALEGPEKKDVRDSVKQVYKKQGWEQEILSSHFDRVFNDNRHTEAQIFIVNPGKVI